MRLQSAEALGKPTLTNTSCIRCLECTKKDPFRNTANSVPLMYALMSFETLVRRTSILRLPVRCCFETNLSGNPPSTVASCF
jgi:hypothetical protein